MGKITFRLILDHSNPAVREAVAKALAVAGYDRKSQANLPNEVVLYPARSDSEERRAVHLATFEAYAYAIRPIFPGMASQILAQVLHLQSVPAAPAQPPPEPTVERDHHGIPANPMVRAAEMGTGEPVPNTGRVDRHGFQAVDGKVRDWASEQAADAALAAAPEETQPRETAIAGRVEEVFKPATTARRGIKMKAAGRPAAVRKGQIEE
jgi:hypothetical protein